MDPAVGPSLQKDNFRRMHWNRSTTIGLARPACTSCHGRGLRPLFNGTEAPCNCVFRAIFRTCYRRFRECAVLAEHISSVSLDYCRGREGSRVYSRKREEFVADFLLVTRRVLSEADYKFFTHHFLLGADWRLCGRQLHMERGDFFHQLYRVEERLGRVFAELTPYPLYPVDQYFSGYTRRDDGGGSLPSRPDDRHADLPLSA
jgi:hypothetical protein